MIAMERAWLPPLFYAVLMNALIVVLIGSPPEAMRVGTSFRYTMYFLSWIRISCS